MRRDHPTGNGLHGTRCARSASLPLARWLFDWSKNAKRQGQGGAQPAARVRSHDAIGVHV